MSQQQQQHARHQPQTPLSPITLDDDENGVGGIMSVVDDQSIGTGMSALSQNSNQTNVSKRSVLGDALLILRGINPKDVILEEEDEEDNYNNDTTLHERNIGSYESAKQNEADVILGTSVVLSKSGSTVNSSTTANNKNGKSNHRRNMTNGTNRNRNTSSAVRGVGGDGPGDGGGSGVRWMEESSPIPRSNGGAEGGGKGKQQLTEISERSDTTHSVLYVDFLQDDYRTMTYGRRIALFMMKRYKWYYPRCIKSVKHNDVMIDNQEPNQEELIEPMHPLLEIGRAHV